MSGRIRLALGDEDQVPRLARFREEHPGVRIDFIPPRWQAIIPEPNGETVINRYHLRQLLDKLESLTELPNDRAATFPPGLPRVRRPCQHTPPGVASGAPSQRLPRRRAPGAGTATSGDRAGDGGRTS